MNTEDRMKLIAASRRQRNLAPYDGPLFTYAVSFTIKAPSKRDADRRMQTLVAELITGAHIDATDLWVRTAHIEREVK